MLGNIMYIYFLKPLPNEVVGLKGKLVIGWIRPEFFGFENTSCRVELEIELSRKNREQRDLWLRPVKNPEALSISGTIYHGKRWIKGGQIDDTLRKALKADAFTRLLIPKQTLEKLLEIWDEWHLNDLRAYCIHQKPIIERLRKENPELLRVSHYRELIKVPELARCPECGYRYGTAWLYEPLPEEVRDYIAYLISSKSEVVENEKARRWWG